MRDAVLEKAAENPAGTAARILDAAEEVFAADGYEAASTREMARRAGVPFGAVHYHWGSKKELWEAVVRRLGDRTRETVLQNLVPGRTLGATLDNMVDAFLELLIANPNTARIGYRMVLEPAGLATPTVHGLIRGMGDLGLAILRDRFPEVEIDGARGAAGDLECVRRRGARRRRAAGVARRRDRDVAARARSAACRAEAGGARRLQGAAMNARAGRREPTRRRCARRM